MAGFGDGEGGGGTEGLKARKGVKDKTQAGSCKG